MALPASTHRLFATDKHVTLVTIDADGSPQASMVWAERDGDQLLIGIESYHRKTRNLRRDPRVTLIVQDDQKSERGLVQYLVIRGTVVLEGPDIPDEYNALMDKQSQRYLGKDYPFENRGSRTALIARVTPERITGEGPWS
ncbi:PPOX class F420-dependent oxidoreductase [Kribbella qitaiheensis]|uniref:PPOX class F420-dependent oxidoreductase n=1 Tax=Kribbella qitaiheensis TaxID=1544730 RepID=A0A7G6X9Q6_9ACTN|nr:PPOX class F420-dependent oxidoreductase [Kribbella qitaiheensis]